MPALACDETKDKDKDKDKPTAAEATTPAEQYKALVDEYQKAQEEFFKLYQDAKTESDRQKLAPKMPQPQKYAGRFLELAEKNPKDPVAVDALLFIVQSSPYGREGTRAFEILAAEHILDKRIGQVCETLTHSRSPAAEKLLVAVLEKNPNREAQGQACLSLGKYLKNQGKEQAAEPFFERVTKEFADVKSRRGTLGQTAETDLFELRYLSIGKVAPEIEGEDIDGKKFRLSDYRGKVVVLDFWGHW